MSSSDPNDMWSSPLSRLLLPLFLGFAAAFLIALMEQSRLTMASGLLWIACLTTLLLAMKRLSVKNENRKSFAFRTRGGSTGPVLPRARRWYHEVRGHTVVRTVGQRKLSRLRTGEFQTYFQKVYWCIHCRKDWPIK